MSQACSINALFLGAMVACGNASVMASPDVSLDGERLCEEGAGSSSCAPNAVCVLVPRAHMIGCVCCTKEPDTSATLVFPASLEQDAVVCAYIAKEWSLVCPP